MAIVFSRRSFDSCFCFIRSPETRSLGVSKLVQLLVLFRRIILKVIQHLCGNLLKTFLRTCLDHFLKVLEVFGGLWGAFLGFLNLAWAASDHTNPKNFNFTSAGFWVLETLDGRLELILAPS